MRAKIGFLPITHNSIPTIQKCSWCSEKFQILALLLNYYTIKHLLKGMCY